MAGFVEQIPGLQIVQSIDDHVYICDQFFDVIRIHVDDLRFDLHLGVHLRQMLPGRFRLRHLILHVFFGK